MDGVDATTPTRKCGLNSAMLDRIAPAEQCVDAAEVREWEQGVDQQALLREESPARQFEELERAGSCGRRASWDCRRYRRWRSSASTTASSSPSTPIHGSRSRRGIESFHGQRARQRTPGMVVERGKLNAQRCVEAVVIRIDGAEDAVRSHAVGNRVDVSWVDFRLQHNTLAVRNKAGIGGPSCSKAAEKMIPMMLYLVTRVAVLGGGSGIHSTNESEVIIGFWFGVASNSSSPCPSGWTAVKATSVCGGGTGATSAAGCAMAVKIRRGAQGLREPLNRLWADCSGEKMGSRCALKRSLSPWPAVQTRE